MRQDNGNDHSAFLERAQRTLDESVDKLDAQTLSRLTQARQQALEKGKSRPYLSRHSFWLSMAGLVTATAVLFFAIFLVRDPSVPKYYSGIEDVEILATYENPNFFAELEFYAWLAEEMDNDS